MTFAPALIEAGHCDAGYCSAGYCGAGYWATKLVRSSFTSTV